MKEITITIMALRYVDKKIKVLELITKDFGSDCISNVGLDISDDELLDIAEELNHYKLLEIQNTDLVSIPNHSLRNEIVLYYKIKNEEKISELLKRMLDKYPKREKPIIKERRLEKMVKYFSNLETKDKIINLLKNCGVTRILFNSKHPKTRIIFDVLNHYALSANKDDFQIFKKIIEGFVHPLMFDDKKEAQGMVDMINSLIENDGFIIKDDNFQRIRNANNENDLNNKFPGKKIPIKNIRLNKSNRMLIINQGVDSISFQNCLKKFKMLDYLWECRWQIKNGKIIQDGDYTSAENLRKFCGCPTIAALNKQKDRLNKLFSNKGIAIKVVNENSQYKLIIYMA